MAEKEKKECTIAELGKLFAARRCINQRTDLQILAIKFPAYQAIQHLYLNVSTAFPLSLQAYFQKRKIENWILLSFRLENERKIRQWRCSTSGIQDI